MPSIPTFVPRHHSRRGRALAAGMVAAGALTVALPATALAATAPPPPVDNTFQLPSVNGLAGSCGSGLVGFSLVPAHAHTDTAGNTLFDQVFGPIGDTSNQVTGTVAFTWFNLATFRGGSGTAPVTPVGPPAEYQSGASSPARTGPGQIVAFAAPNLTVFGRPCNITPSVGTYFSP